MVKEQWWSVVIKPGDRLKFMYYEVVLKPLTCLQWVLAG